jgi:hypothetical protein
MKVLLKTTTIAIVIIIGFLSININPTFGTNGSHSSRSQSRAAGGFDWSEIEVLSEPIFGSNVNNLTSDKPRIAVEGDNIYVVWSDESSLNGAGSDSDIFYRYHNGSEWSDIQVISEPVFGSDINQAASILPDIAVKNGNIYLVWYDANNTDGSGIDGDIFYRSNLTGTGWEDIQVISEPVKGADFNTKSSRFPKIEVENNKIFVTWEDYNDTYGAGLGWDIFYRCNLTGSNWENIQVISEPVQGQDFNIGESSFPDIALENGNIYVVWEDDNDTNNASTDKDIFIISNTTGTGWGDIQVISEPVYGEDNNIAKSNRPDITVKNNKIYIVWQDDNVTDGSGFDADIFYRCCLDGVNWEDVQVISEPKIGSNHNIGNSAGATIAVENDNIYVVWRDDNYTYNAGSGDFDIFFKCNISGFGWEKVEVISEPVPGYNFAVEDSQAGQIAVDSGNIHVVWYDQNNTNGASFMDFDIFYRRTLLKLNLDSGKVVPTTGNTSTNFNFSVTYNHYENTPPTKILVNISGVEYPLIESDFSDTNYADGKQYFLNLAHLNIGTYSFRFFASDGDSNRLTSYINFPEVYNTKPIISTLDNLTAYEDVFYAVQYEYNDIDRENIGQFGTWNYSTNASWLNFVPTTAILSGTPTDNDVGKYWVNISINDSIEIDFTNFTLTVENINDDPVINTSNIEITYEDELYSVDYNATDIDSYIGLQTWSLTTNATMWLDIEAGMGLVSGIPTNDDVGEYWVNVSVNDGDTGSTFTNFTLIVLNVNDYPIITTEDVLEAPVNKLYKVDYNATDIDNSQSELTWSLDGNAGSWLSIDSTTGVLNGIPGLTDVGQFDVNVTVNDGDGGVDWHKFELTISPLEIPDNDQPIITTTDKKYATVDVLYRVDYNATDDRTPIDLLVWAFNTNASWLAFNTSTGILYGTPWEGDLGSYWINISVNDNEGGWAYTEFTLWVTMEPVIPDLPELIDPIMTPSSGDTDTNFTFSVRYDDPEGDEPDYIRVVIDGVEYDMEKTNGAHEYTTKLAEGNHTYYHILFPGI